MPLIELETVIRAPVERVFDLARIIDAHTVSVEGSRERAVAGRTSGMIELDETVIWEAWHFGVKQRLTVKITEFDRPRMFADQHVFRAFRLHCCVQGKVDWTFYELYRKYFGNIAKACRVALEPENVLKLKRIDNALMVFGQFLNKYFL